MRLDAVGCGWMRLGAVGCGWMQLGAVGCGWMQFGAAGCRHAFIALALAAHGAPVSATQSNS